LTDHQPITKPQAEALAQLLHQLRPEWGVPALMTLIGRNINHPATYPQLVLAAVTAANRRNPDGTHTARTPAVIYQPGKHWETPVGETPAHIPASPPCEDHPTFEHHNCRACWGDVKAGLRPRDLIGKHHEPRTEEAS